MSAADDKYNASEKGKARQRRYDATWKGRSRQQRYNRTAAGYRRHIEYDKRDGHETRIQEDALREREEYEASGSDLSFIDWLNATYPLPMFRPI